MSATTVPNLHVPDEPTARAKVWLASVLDGNELTTVLIADDGLVAWLWSRWSTLGTAGVTFDRFSQMVLDNRREVWLWLAGERTWAQSCSGLVGRVNRRIAQGTAPAQ